MKRLNQYLILSFLLLMSFSQLKSQTMFSKFSGVPVGDPKISGSTSFDTEKQTFTLNGAGENVWFDNDQFWFEFQKIKGDFIFSANVEFIGEGVNPHRKLGLMARSSTDANSAYVDVCVHGDGLTGMQFREKTGNNTDEFKSYLTAPEFVQVERMGNVYKVRVSKNNEALVTIAEKTFDLGDEILLGMFVCSHEQDVLEAAKFSNVRVEVPAAEGIDGYRMPSPSRLEILDVETGLRKVIYETTDHIEAPNWSVDGKYLIINKQGKLYKFDLEVMKPEEINTDFATSCNNDHVLSFDGKMLAISNSISENDRTYSIVFTVPVEGGVPKRVTEKGPSYLHGWSLDAKWLTYCAERNGNYDVYKIPVEGGEEIRLTTTEGLDDGPEYSPDGEYIYFNSVRTGMMQIWRMRPDGSEQEQITFDNYQNWFAHLSPDGKQMIMISYPPSVPAGSHPHNQRVMLRTLPVAGGVPKVKAFLYGGQGTLNVPSWSPDSKKVAFVSYTY